ncbi:TlpA family protein disulfide reductase [Paenimyroides aestuarii]|uniref:TlpA family protein disulfide reductase n=1 Tax=Paenimyroides aestuarii TaxID=2968490 RepID=A0ABY5NP27_9FLAO|nr:TlpA disulfide reductase family protein [Paenimyroides aestuarii]UUV20303.1 TlpA family protein disulfide reductase [Paenimyroides aestuarii]
MNNIILSFILCISTSLVAQTAEDKALINEIIQKYNSHSSMMFDINYMIKFFDEEQPIYLNSSVKIERDLSDKVFRSKFAYTRNDSMFQLIKYYDTKNLYVIEHKNKKITQYNTKKKETFPVTGNIDGRVIDVYFSKIANVPAVINNQKNIKTYTDSANYIIVKLQFPDKDDYYDETEQLYFNKELKVIDKITYSAKYKDQIQKNQWLLSNITFNTFNSNDLKESLQQYFDTYTLEDYKPLTEEDYKLLSNKSKAPEIKGFLYPDYTKETDLKFNKIKVIDFWYTSCMPCIQAIPALNQIHKEFKDYVDVIGINPMETKLKDQQRIEKFLKRTPVNYDILLVNGTIPKAYNVRVYPTVYIIGTDGKIKYSAMGYSETLHNELRKELKKLIKKHR